MAILVPRHGDLQRQPLFSRRLECKGPRCRHPVWGTLSPGGLGCTYIREARQRSPVARLQGEKVSRPSAAIAAEDDRLFHASKWTANQKLLSAEFHGPLGR